MPDIKFAVLLDRVQNTNQEDSLIIPDDWMQGRTAYGGLIASIALASMRKHVAQERKVRSLFVSFVGPVSPEPFFVKTKLLRSGKSVSTVESKLIQNDNVCCTAVGSFGGDRDSKIEIEPIERIQMLEPSKALELPYIDGMTPAFTRHFDYRLAVGELPFSGKSSKEIAGWISFREETICLTEEWLIALADAWPTPVLSQLTEPAAASTLAWSLGFVHLNRNTCSQNDWWSYHCLIDSAERGYAHERSTIFDPEGNLALYSHQTTTVFA